MLIVEGSMGRLDGAICRVAGGLELRQPARQPAQCWQETDPMILYSIILPFVSSAARIFALFLHHFCTMKSISKLYRATPSKVPSKSQLIVSELVATGDGIGRKISVKKSEEHVKIAGR